MSQHDYVIENQDGASFRGDINAALAAIVSQNSGLTEPVAPYAYMLWQDTTTGILKQRNAANTAWVALVDAIAVRPLTSGTVVATTSGTSIDFTSIPSWVKRITIMLNGVSMAAGTSPLAVQIGSGSIQTTGYVAGGTRTLNGSATAATSSTAAFPLYGWGSAATTMSGHLTLTNVSGNIWVASHSCHESTPASISGGGVVTLSGVLDRVRLTSIAGTDTFDAGSVNILYE